MKRDPFLKNGLSIQANLAEREKNERENCNKKSTSKSIGDDVEQMANMSIK